MVLLRSLRSRNYRLYFTGQAISLVGTWMQMVALSWLVYRMNPGPRGAAVLGLVAFAGQIPGLIFMPLGGILADRLNRRRVLITTQSLAMLQALILSAFVLSNAIHLWEIIALSVFQGLVMSVDAPTRQSFVVEMTDSREDLGNAIALNSTLFNGARVVGPAIAGALIVIVGEGMCFLINGISFLAVIACLIAMRIPPRPANARGKNVLHDIKEGAVYVIRFKPILYVLISLTVVSLMGMPYAVLMPIFAKKILHGGSTTYGLLTGCTGIGALLGAFFLASRRSVVGLDKWIARAGAIFGASIIAFAFSRTLWLSTLLLVGAGFGFIVQMASSNTIIQTIVDEDKRGRVMSLYTLAFMGGAPFGSLFAGHMATAIGPQYTVMIGGAACIAGAGLFALALPGIRKIVHPIYARMGIIPEIATGVQMASQLTTPPEER